MIRALSTSATGMHAQEARLDQVSNDLANMNTTAFKRGRTEFQDLVYQTVKEAGGEAGQGASPVGIQVGSGTKVSAQYSVYDQGPVRVTNGLFDIMINGDGFFPIQMDDGTTAYTRAGTFQLDKGGMLLTPQGNPLVPAVQIPTSAEGVTITPNGIVRVMTSQGEEQDVGRIQLVKFLNPSALKKIDGNRVIATTAAGEPTVANPGDAGMGTLQQGALEMSNVKPTESMMDMITTQRAYESNARVMGVADQMWQTTNNITNR